MGKVHSVWSGQTQNKRQLKLKHFIQFYQEGHDNPPLPQLRHFGFKKDINNIRQRQDLPHITPQLIQEQSSPQSQSRIPKNIVQNTSTYPYSCIGLLLIHFDEQFAFGTGSLIGKNLVLTAASNVYNRSTAKFATKIEVVFNFDGQTGSVYEADLNTVFFNQKFLDEPQGSYRYDYSVFEFAIEEVQGNDDQNGVINFSFNPGLRQGYLGIQTTVLPKQTICFCGYSTISNQNQHNFILTHQKMNLLMSKNAALGYKMNSFRGQSGSPLMILREGHFQVIGIHINGRKGLSCGLQFDQQIRRDINGWVEPQTQGEIDLSEAALSASQVLLFNSYEWSNMAVIYLNSNNIGGQGLTNLTQRPWPMLKELYLSNNNINKLQFQPQSIINLAKLYLSQNSIKEVGLLTSLPLLKVLNLSSNKIQQFDQLCGLKYMERLDLSSNKISKIPKDISHLKELKKIYFSRNQLDSLPVQLLKLSQMTVLAIDCNKIKHLPQQLIKNLEQSNVQVITQ